MRWANAAKQLAIIVALGTAVGACSGGGDDASLSTDELADAGDRCPVDLSGAIGEAGLEADGDVAVEVTEGSGEGGQDATPVDQAGGVYVECRQPVADGEVRAVVFGSERPGAIGLLLPQIAQDLGLGADQLEEVFERADDTDAGELIDFGADGPAAGARLDIDGAESGVLYVSSSSGASSEQVRAVAQDLLDGL